MSVSGIQLMTESFFKGETTNCKGCLVSKDQWSHSPNIVNLHHRQRTPEWEYSYNVLLYHTSAAPLPNKINQCLYSLSAVADEFQRGSKNPSLIGILQVHGLTNTEKCVIPLCITKDLLISNWLNVSAIPYAALKFLLVNLWLLDISSWCHECLLGTHISFLSLRAMKQL